MAYDEGLAERIRLALADVPGVEEKKMFGGLAFMVHGHIAASAHNDGRLLITCSRDDFDRLQAEPGAGPMVQRGKPMSGWVLIDADAVAEDAALALWVRRGVAHSQSKPPK